MPQNPFAQRFPARSLVGQLVRRGRSSAVAVTIALMLFAASIAFGETIQWQTLKAATEQARAQKKLLMVVQGPDGITTLASDSSIAKSYVQAALKDERLKDFYEFRVVAHYRATGPTPTTNAPARKRKETSMTRNVVTYFCLVGETRDLETLHFFVGYPTSEQLQTHCDWACELQAQIAKLSASERREVVREAHRKRLLHEPALPAKRTTRRAVRKIVMEASKLRDQKLLARFGKGWTAVEQRKLLGALRPHAELENTVGHAVLAEHPLVPLSELEQPAFKEFTKQSYQPSPLLFDGPQENVDEE